MIPVLRTSRLALREWRDTDRQPFAAMNADPAVMEHFPATMTPQQSDEMITTYLALWAARGHGTWAVELVDAGRFVGIVMVTAPSWPASFTPCLDVGWRLTREEWGQGFATEAATAAIDWAFANLDPPRDEIVSFTTTANLRSRRVMERLGFTHDPAGDFDHPLLPDWTEHRHVLYRLPRRSWRNV